MLLYIASHLLGRAPATRMSYKLEHERMIGWHRIEAGNGQL